MVLLDEPATMLPPNNQVVHLTGLGKQDSCSYYVVHLTRKARLMQLQRPGAIE